MMGMGGRNNKAPAFVKEEAMTVLQMNSAVQTAMPVPVNQVSIFDHPEFGAVRVTRDEADEPLFIAKDVCEALGYTWNGLPRISHVPEEWRGVTSVVTPSGTQEMHYLTEQGLYFFLGRSDKPGALPYQKWLAGEVVPALRKRGIYATPDVADAIINDPDLGIRLLTELKQERLARAEAEEAARIEAERAEHYRKTKAEIGSRREATSMATASIAVRKAGALEDALGIGRNYKQVKGIPWLSEEFDFRKLGEHNGYSQIGKKLTALSERQGYPPRFVPDERYPGGVKSYHVDVIDAFRGQLRMDLNMLGQFRRR
jgi:prophage antirepressor-like protein